MENKKKKKIYTCGYKVSSQLAGRGIQCTCANELQNYFFND